MERRDSITIRRFGVGAGGNKQLHRIEITPMSRPVEGGHTLRIWSVRVYMLLQQRMGGYRVAVLDRCDKPRINACGSKACGSKAAGTQQNRHT